MPTQPTSRFSLSTTRSTLVTSCSTRSSSLRNRPTVRDQIRARFKFVLVDEFQDTNDAQYEIVKLIAEPRRNLTVVGDDDQSIYKFRGASLANILKFEEDFPDAKRVVLIKNYRSAQEILDRAHAFIQHNNPNRLEAAAERNLSKKLEAGLDLAAQIEHIHALTATEEVARVVERIVGLKSEEGTDWSDFAIFWFARMPPVWISPSHSSDTRFRISSLRSRGSTQSLSCST